jgi:hypothetical protein
MISKPFVALIALILLSGCAGWVEKRYVERASKACVDAGYTMIHPQYHECEENTVIALKEQDAQIESQSSSNALVAGAVMGAYYSAKAQSQVDRGPNVHQSAEPTYPLIRQWIEVGGHRFCEYSNGTILNVGTKLCALSIEG